MVIKFRYSDPEEFIRELGQVLVAFQITQSRLAFEAGMDRPRVNNYLRGRRRPTLDTMLRLDRALSHILYRRRNSGRRPRAEHSR